MHFKDRDKNTASVDVWTKHNRSGVDIGARKAVVAVHANGVWFTPAQARRFAKAILRAADRAAR